MSRPVNPPAPTPPSPHPLPGGVRVVSQDRPVSAEQIRFCEGLVPATRARRLCCMQADSDAGIAGDLREDGWQRGLLLCLLPQIMLYLVGRPLSAAQAVLAVSRRWVFRVPVSRVCRDWRHTMPNTYPANAPIPTLAPDGRAGFIAPSGLQCGGYWLGALAEVYFLGPPLLYRRTTWRGEGEDDSPVGWMDGETIRHPDGRLADERRRLQAMQLDRFRRHLEHLRAVRWWGLDVETAAAIERDWLPGGFQVTLFVGGRLYRATERYAYAELMLDMDRYRWVAVHTWNGVWRFQALQMLPERCRWWRCYGNGGGGGPL